MYYIVDSHCDSLGIMVNEGADHLITPYNFSKKYPQLQLIALFCGRAKENGEESYARAKRYIKAFSDAVRIHADEAIRVQTAADLERFVNEKKHGFMFSAEGAGKGIFYKRELVSEMYEAGVRVIGLTWTDNEFAKSNRLNEGGEDTGLSELGRELVREIDSLGMIFDVSHLSDKSFYDLEELSTKPIIATHSNFRSVCNHTRNLTDDMARIIFKRGGMIGLNFCLPFISADIEKQTVEGLFEHLDYGMSLGGENNIGLGGDVDGVSEYPNPLTKEASMHDKIIELMLRHNYPERLVNKVAGENYIEFFRKHL